MGNNYERLKYTQAYRTDIPKYMIEKLHAESDRRRVPISRLIAMAIDIQLDSDNPFEFDLSDPKEDFVEYAYVDEAGRILNWLRQFKEGIELEMIALSRHEFEVHSLKTFMLAWRECKVKDFVQEATKFRRKTGVPYKVWKFKP